jgi:hypothetical protein
MGARIPTIKVHLREVTGFPEMTVVQTQITAIRHDTVDGLSRASITTTTGGQVIKTTETYQDVLDKMEIT